MCSAVGGCQENRCQAPSSVPFPPTQVGRILLDMTEHCGLSPKLITKRKIRKTSPLQVDQSMNSLFHGDFCPFLWPLLQKTSGNVKPQ